MSVMIKSGISLSKVLNIMYDSTTRSQLKSITANLYEGVQSGKSMSFVMNEMNGVFPEFLTYMVEIGEIGGNLDNVMSSMSFYYEEELKINNKLKTAMIYPIILVLVTIIAVSFILIFIFPKFTSFFAGMELPAPTRILLMLSNLLSSKWWAVLLFLIAASVVILYFMTIPSFKTKIHEKKLTIPVFGKLNRTMYTSKFSTAFSIMYTSGVSIITCIDVAAKVMGNLYVKNRLEESSKIIKNGGMLSEGLNSVNIFDKLFISMVLVGEESGVLDKSLKDSGEYFAREADISVAKMMAMVEPIMIIVLAIIIGFIVIAIMLPIFSIYTQIY
jgi:type IV pilus assembly protein PilC